MPVNSEASSKTRGNGIVYGYGTHVMIDGTECDVKRLDDIRFIYQFLNQLPDKIEMRKIMPPYTFYHDGAGVKEDRGFSGIVIIAESHISIHTYPEKGFLTFDLYSCKKFDTEKTMNYVIKAFGIQKPETRIFNRGREFPKDIKCAAHIVEKDREKLSQ